MHLKALLFQNKVMAKQKADTAVTEIMKISSIIFCFIQCGEPTTSRADKLASELHSERLVLPC